MREMDTKKNGTRSPDAGNGPKSKQKDPAEKQVKVVDTEGFLKEAVEQKVAYNTRDAILYALGIGATERRYSYELDKQFMVFPTYPLILTIKGQDDDTTSFPSPTMLKGPQTPLLPGVRVGVDGERVIECFKPLPKKKTTLKMVGKVVGIHQRGSGALVETQFDFYGAKDEQHYARVINGVFFKGAHSFRDSGVSHSENIVYPTDRAPDHVVELPTSEYQSLLYRLSGDYNPLHVDPQASDAAGFHPMLHPHALFGFTSRAVIKTFCNNNAEYFRSMKGRFVSVVIPGETLVMEMWQSPAPEDRKILVRTKVKESGRVVLSNAYVVLSKNYPRKKKENENNSKL